MTSIKRFVQVTCTAGGVWGAAMAIDQIRIESEQEDHLLVSPHRFYSLCVALMATGIFVGGLMGPFIAITIPVTSASFVYDVMTKKD